MVVESLPGELPEVGLLDARLDEVGGDVPLHPLDPGVRRHLPHEFGDEVGRSLAPERVELPAVVPVVRRRPLDDERRVYLQVVRPELGAGEQPPEVLPAHLLRHAGLAGHHVKAHLEPGVTQPAVGVDRGLHAVPAVHLAVHPFEGGLHADLHLRPAQAEHPVYLFGVTPVRLRLEGGRDVSHVGGLVLGEDVLDVGELPFLHRRREALVLRWAGVAVHVVVVHRLDGAADEPLLVVVTAGGHRPAHQDQLGLVDRVTNGP